MATLTVRKITDAGLDPDSPAWDVAAAGGDDFANDGNTYIHVNNADASPITVTIPIGTDPYANDPLHATTDSTVAVAANSEAKLGPFPIVRYGNSVSIAYSAVASVTVAAFSL